MAPPLPAGFPIRPDTYGKVRKACPGYDPYYMENEWRMWAAGKPAPASPDAAFISFCKTYAKNHPL